ncbi:hypothetical protein EIMP300_71310 [Escherichia coli]|uniref:SpoOB alpha-helical domain-containing protein n=1 Tax=Escherichia coli TaxID=562 RepID=A0A8S0G098_ECOLX|nr:hypothetical protein EIMP300_71310 [Escherichia coli]
MILIHRPGRQWLGKPIAEVVRPADFFTEQIDEKRQDVVANFNGLSVIANREAIRSGDDLLGAIISFRSKDEISTLNAQLTQIKQYVESLRTLRHEHLNWMSTLNGLLQMKEYDRVLAMVQGESQAQQQLIDSLREAFADRQVAGLLFGKVQRARELGLKMVIVPAKVASFRNCRQDWTAPSLQPLLAIYLITPSKQACVAMKETRLLNYTSAMKAMMW